MFRVVSSSKGSAFVEVHFVTSRTSISTFLEKKDRSTYIWGALNKKNDNDFKKSMKVDMEDTSLISYCNT